MTWLKRLIPHIVALTVHKLDRFLGWLFQTKNPLVISVREFIRGNRLLLWAARKVIRVIRHLPGWIQGQVRAWFMSAAQRRVQAVVAARAVGGAISPNELDHLWAACRGRRRVLCMAAGLERTQIEIVLAAARVNAVCHAGLDAPNGAEANGATFDLIIAAPAPGKAPREADLRARLRRNGIFLAVGAQEKRSEYFDIWDAQRRSSPDDTEQGGADAACVQPARRRVVFLNDVGFQYGAGIALKRQAASFLLNGCEVHVVAWNPGANLAQPAITGIAQSAGWGGFHLVTHCHHSREMAPEAIVAEVVSTVRGLQPDVVIMGNLHGTDWPVGLIQQLGSIDALVVAYMHDCYWATGRCAYPVTCRLYEVGCNETCPTPHEYPRLPPPEIAPAWRLKGEIFGREAGLPLVTNSAWTEGLARRRFGAAADISCVHLAVDHELFAPMDKALARRLLGLPAEGDIVVMGAVDILNKWKGGELFRGIHGELLKRDGVSLVLFGHSSGILKSTKSFGLIDDERLLPLILNSADIFVGTATEEAFGQTLLEASSCGLPVVAFDVGGVSDVVVNGETGVLVSELSVVALHAAINRLLSDVSLREVLGRNARRRVEDRFTLTRQSDAWTTYIEARSDSRRRVALGNLSTNNG